MRVVQLSKTRTTTIRLPRSLYEEAKAAVQRENGEPGKSRSLNDLFVSALKSHLKRLKRREIDAAFAGMAEDIAYQREAESLLAEFQQSDWEAFRIKEKNLSRGSI